MGMLGRISRHSISLADRRTTSRISMSSITSQDFESNITSTRYTVVRRKSIVISEDTPPCCPDLPDSENGPKTPQDGSHIFTNSMDMTDLGDLGMDFSCDATDRSETQKRGENLAMGTDEDFPYGPWSAVPDLHCATLISQSDTSDFDLSLFSSDYSPLGEQENECTPPMSEQPTIENFDFQESNNTSSGFSYQQPQGTKSDPIHPDFARHHGRDLSGTARQSMNNALDLECQTQPPEYRTSSPPPMPTTQTTIKLDNPEPRTVAAIMAILINSKARVKFETQ